MKLVKMCQDAVLCNTVHKYDIIVHCTMCNMILVKIQYWYFPGQYCDKYQYRYVVPEQVPNLSSPPAHRRPKPSDYVVVCAGSSSCHLSKIDASRHTCDQRC